MVVAFAPDTGNTATIVFGTSAFTAKYHEIGASEQEVPKIKDSHLGTTVKETCQPGDLYDPGEVDCEFQYVAGVNPPIGGAPETVTITYPVPTGKTTGATLAGTAFIRKRKSSSLKNNELLIGSYTLCWDGKTGPTFTAAA
jgi:hypothetical protein